MNHRVIALRALPEDVFTGTPGNDTLTGTTGGDTIRGGDGNDLLQGMDGKDYLYGGNGGDTMLGGNGVDALYGEGGNDSMDGGAGRDTLDGGIGNDTMMGSGELRGGGGNDALQAGADRDGTVLWGGTGNDRLRSGVISDDLYGEDGNDLLIAFATDAKGDFLTGGLGDDTLQGSTGGDTLMGNEGIDLLQGGAGDDLLIISHTETAGDTLDGGLGDDTLNADWASDLAGIVWTNDPTQVQVVNGHTLSGFEHINLSTGAGNDVIINTHGDEGDFVFAGGGNDHVEGVSASGFDGNDTLIGSERGDLLVGGLGDDSLLGGGGDDSLVASEGGSDSLYGGDGDDTVEAAHRDGEHGALDGGAGLDELLLNWGAATDNVVLDFSDPGVADTTLGTTLVGFELVSMTTGSGNDTLVGGADDWISSQDGDDSVTGGTVYAGYGNDTMRGTSSGDYLSGSEGNDLGWGGKGSDHLTGDDGNDTLYGENGNDTLAGGSGIDSLFGGKGNDMFALTSGGTATVADFVQGSDAILAFNYIGDNDHDVEGAVVLNGPGGFAATAELVIVTADVASFTTAAAAAAIGSASSAYTQFRSAVFAVDNGVDTAVYYFASSGTDAVVSAAELTLMGTIVGVSDTGVGDYGF